MRRWAMTGLAAAMLIAVGGGAAGAQEPGAAAAAARIDWSKCGARLECARVPVPLDWDRPDGAKITLSVARYLASRPAQRIGSLFVNFGGPGVAGAAPVKEAGALLDGLGDGRFDVVGWDPRGTGESTHVRCFADDAGLERFWGPDWTIPTTPAESRRYVPKTVDYARRCEALSGALLAHISTKDTVRDLDYLRQLVGDRQLTYRGLSYGAFLGQTYANMFPHRVRAMILDGVIDAVEFTKSVEANLAESDAGSDQVFEQFLALCQAAGPKKCALAGKGPVAPRVRALLQRLRQGPIPARSAPPPRQLRYGDALIAFWLALGTPSSWPKLAAGLDQAADGDGSRLATPVREARGLLPEALVSAVALQCADKPLPRPGAVQAWPTVIERSGPPLSHRSTAGRCGRRALPGGRPARTATPAPGMPPPRTRSWSSATATTPGQRSRTPASPHAC